MGFADMNLRSYSYRLSLGCDWWAMSKVMKSWIRFWVMGSDARGITWVIVGIGRILHCKHCATLTSNCTVSQSSSFVCWKLVSNKNIHQFRICFGSWLIHTLVGKTYGVIWHMGMSQNRGPQTHLFLAKKEGFGAPQLWHPYSETFPYHVMN